MKAIISGGRDYRLTCDNYEFLDWLLPDITEVVHGGCRGADSDAGWWAELRAIPCTIFPAEWEKGKKAGPERNRKMAEYADAVILFPGGRGTQSMADEASGAGLKIWDERTPDPIS